MLRLRHLATLSLALLLVLPAVAAAEDPLNSYSDKAPTDDSVSGGLIVIGVLVLIVAVFAVRGYLGLRRVREQQRAGRGGLPASESGAVEG